MDPTFPEDSEPHRERDSPDASLDHLPQPQNSNNLSSAPLRDKLLTNSSYLAAEIPHKLGHWVSHLWQNPNPRDQAPRDESIWLLGCHYAMSTQVQQRMEQAIMQAQQDSMFATQTAPTSANLSDPSPEPAAGHTGTTPPPPSSSASASASASAFASTSTDPPALASLSLSQLWPPDFYEDWLTKLWMTYRHNYPPIRPSNYTTDIGWGCMLRSGQSLLANTLLIHFLKRDWRRRGRADPHWKEYRRILQWFLDELSPRAPFSIHRIALLGKQLGKNIGEWFGPSTISQVILALVSDFPSAKLGVYVATDGVVYRDDVRDIATGKRPRGEFGYWHHRPATRTSSDTHEESSHAEAEEARKLYQKSSQASAHPAEGEDGVFRSILILVSIRLGIDSVHPTYHPALKACFELPWFVGIAGGRPNSSLYFIGLQGDDLIYLDPHFSRPALETKHIEKYGEEDFSSYHCTIPRKLHISQVDPSMLLGFYCRTQAEFDAFCETITQIASQYTPIFTIEKRAPEYDEDVRSENDFGIVSDEDEEEQDAFGDSD